ncbi:RluA family pseudouridine synthase, partial [Lactiplantibacillus plantarum]
MTWTYQLTIPSSLNQQSIRACLRTWLIPKRIQGQLRQTRRIQLNGAP